jgi:hypothetical protein
MKLIKTEDVEGYDYKEVVRKYPNFKKWFAGQTCEIYKGKFIVYKWDMERFLQGLPVID